MLKSTFFLEKLDSFGFFKLYEDIKKIAFDHAKAHSWNERKDWCIDEQAWEAIKRTKINPLLVFAHPNILKIYPAMLKYYRSVAMLPQKGLSAISGFSGIRAVENEKKGIPEKKLGQVLCALNEVMSTLIKLVSALDEEKIKGMMFATAGTTIDGSWRNQIGSEGERVIRSLILRKLLDNKEVTAFVLKNGSSKSTEEWDNEDPVKHINEIKSFTNINGTVVIFGSEPDIEFRNSEGKVLGGVEIKAGLDPAGALERLGAMFKSFENMLQQYPAAATILIASCITDEVGQRLRTSRSVQQTYITTDVMSNEKGQADKFCNSIRGILELVEKRM